MEKDFEKVRKIIESCNTFNQLDVARNTVDNFKSKHKDNSLYKCLLYYLTNKSSIIASTYGKTTN